MTTPTPDPDASLRSARGSSLRHRAVRAARWAGFVGAYAAAQGVSMALSGDVRREYRRVEQPPFAPPAPVIPAVWTVLNVTTATSAWRMWEAPASPARTQALGLWGVALGLRTAYTPLAFGQRWRWLATADAAALALVMAAYTQRAARVDRAAAALAAPEVAWTTFATALSTDLARRNPESRR
jgi:benzodiazapine receptor